MRHLTGDQRQALRQASQDRQNLANRVFATLSMAGRNVAEGDQGFVDRVETCTYGAEDGIAVVLQATVLGRLRPAQYEQQECRVDWTIQRDDGTLVPCPGFVGKIIEVQRQGAFTSIIAATEGYEAEDTPIGEDVNTVHNYPGYQPDTVLFEVLNRLGYTEIDLPRIRQPKLSARAEPFTWVRSVKEVAEWVESQAKLRVVDMPWNVVRAYALRQQTGDPVWALEEGRDLGIGELADETGDERRYARVKVTRLKPVGFGTGEIEVPLATAKVDNGDRRVNPRSVKFIPYDATEVEGTEMTNNAYALAFEEAERLGNLPGTYTAPVNYPPFWLGRGALVAATGREYIPTAAGTVTLSDLHHFRADSVVVDAVAKSGTISGEGRLLETWRDPVIPPRFSPSRGIVVA